MCIDNFQYVCGELIHIFQRHDLKCYQALLILSVEKKPNRKQRKQFSNRKIPNSQPSHSLQEWDSSGERASLHAASPKRSDLHLVLVLAGVQQHGLVLDLCWSVGNTGMFQSLLINPCKEPWAFLLLTQLHQYQAGRGQGAVRENSWDPHCPKGEPRPASGHAQP